MATRSNLKVLIYSQDGFGLGHLRRNMNICLAILRRDPRASILIIADSPVAPFFRLPHQCDFIKIPTIIKIDSGVWRSEGLSVDYDELLQIRSEIIRNSAISFKPHVFLVDHMPHGALGELTPTLKDLKKYSPDTKIVLGLRDILGAPDVIHRQWKREGAFEALEEFYDAVNIYGCKDVFDLMRQYDFPMALFDRCHYRGYVCRQNEYLKVSSKTLKTLQRLFGDHERQLILTTGGGGADAWHFMEQFIEAVRLVKDDIQFNAIITTGPFMEKTKLLKLREMARELPIVVSRFGQDSIQYLKRADLIISMAGYNTVSEILRYRKKAIVVPRRGPSAEQSMRAQILTDRQLAGSIHPNSLTAETFSELIYHRLQNGPDMKEEMIPDLGGATSVATMIAEMN